MNFQAFVILAAPLSLALSAQACAQSSEGAGTSKEVVVSAVPVTPETPTMTLEEIRAKQRIIEAKIAKIKSKGELERADKIALLKLTNILIVLKESETAYQQKVIQEQKHRLAHEFSELRKETKN